MTPILYGGYYTAVKFGLFDIPVFWLNSLRLLLASILYLPFLKHLKNLTKEDYKKNLIIAGVFFGGLVAQSFSLKYLTAGGTGFLAALFLIFTPLFRWLIFRKRLSKWFVIPIILSLIGYTIMFEWYDNQGPLLGLGEWLGIFGAVAIALQIVFTEEYVPDSDPFAYSYLQIIYSLLLSLIFALNLESFPPIERIG